MKTRKALATGLAGMGLGYALWRGWEKGLEKTWTKVLGPHDLGPIDFHTLHRRVRSRDALASAKAVSPRSTPDFEPPVFRIDPDRLRAIVAEFAASEADTTQVFADTGIRQDRYLTRTRLMRLPGTVDVRILDLGEGRATLAIYARSPRRGSDLGANRKRVKRWLDHIAERVSRETQEAEA